MSSEDPRGREIEFEEFVLALLRAGDLTITAERGADVGVDLIAQRRDGTITVVEAKTDTPSTQLRLRVALAQLHEAAQRLPDPSPKHLILAVPGVLSDEHRDLSRSAGVELWDGPSLSAMMDRTGVSPPVGVPLSRHLSTRKPRGMQLRHRLRGIDRGKPGWLAYQQFFGEALDYLFSPPLEAPLVERSDAVRVNRRDFILPNYADYGFWAFMRTHYHADYLVIDARNFSGLVTKTPCFRSPTTSPLMAPGSSE